ncbi:DUF706-domain-containing protein [Aspergillus affinis]|uniref:DUF706-domain-containing protein n=1 Tax=Aspergillus affinis TaxID=1070780 RepID=UPI0022FEE9B3|nr:DUF706-domain-containing protein [Aspergillus affinis]KAI9041797.1 DUF706-domain-containing protein [Aspergillus affinis]
MTPFSITSERGVPSFTHPHEGQRLQNISDAVYIVNNLKSNLKRQKLSNRFDQDSEFDKEKDKVAFRQFESASDHARDFYKEQHSKKTVAYNLKARHAFHSKVRAEMGIWEAIEKLITLIDESDPDTNLSQIEHLLQSAEAARRNGKLRWMQLVDLFHDLGKLLFYFDAEGQWDVVGDTSPVGCAYDERVCYGRDSFSENKVYVHATYDTIFGIYSPGCGLENVMLSWGHDEYLYYIVKDQSTLPSEGLAMIRYHSLYPWHMSGVNRELMNDHDHKMICAVQAFNPYDLYSKSDEIPSIKELKVRNSFST